MTKILFSADHHFDETRRFEECIRIHDWMVEQAREHEVDAFVSCGDIYERSSTPRERDAVSQWLQAMARVCRVYIAKGNHDRALDCAIMAKLACTHPITVCESAGVFQVGDVSLALVAWPERTGLLQWAESEGRPPEQAAHEVLRALLAGLSLQLAENPGPRILAGHFMVDGSVTSVGQPLLGLPMNVSLTDLASVDADLAVMGHVHNPQHWRHEDKTILYTGSPYRTSFGETEVKSVVLVEATADRIGWRRLDTPCRPMLLVETTWLEDEGFAPWSTVVEPRNAEIRFRYRVHPDLRRIAAEHAEALSRCWLGKGAYHVLTDEIVESSTRARAPEIASAQTLADKLRALWTVQRDVPAPPRDKRLIDMALTLEAADD
jgi:exonuclease SbcD